MSIWSWLFSQSSGSSTTPEVVGPSVNPSTGLPMLGDIGVDVAGNLFGSGSAVSSSSGIHHDSMHCFGSDGFDMGCTSGSSLGSGFD